MDIENIRQRAEFLALETLMMGVLKAMQRQSPAFAESLQAVGNQKAEEYRWLAFRDSPEMSDLLAAEFHEAWTQLMQRALLKPDK